MRSSTYGFIYDDDIIIQAQAAPRSVQEYARIFSERHYPTLPYYRPISRLSMLLQKGAHGDMAGLFHLGNAIMMGVLAVVGFRLLVGCPFKVPPVAAAVTVGLYSIHPAVSSVVFPIVGRETLLSTLFMLSAMRFFFRDDRNGRWFAFLSFLLALFSKEQAVLLPLIFVLADILGLRANRPTTSRQWLGTYSPYVFAVAGYALVRISLFRGQELLLNIVSHPMDFFLTYLFSIQTVFTPFYHLAYEPPFQVWFSLPRLLIALALLAVFALTAFVHRGGKGRQLLFWAGWFIVVQLPTANIIWQEAQFEERYVFASMFGAYAAAALAVGDSRNHRLKGTVAALCGVVLVFSFMAGAARGDEFKDAYSFFKRWQESNPKSAIAHFNYGVELMKRGDKAGGREQMELARRLNPTLDILGKLSRYYLNEQKFNEAIVLFREMLQIDPGNAFVHTTMAWALQQRGEDAAAEEHYRVAVRLDPGDAEAPARLGSLLARTGRPQEAVGYFNLALSINPDNPATLNNLGRAWFDQGQADRAIAAYEKALQSSPDDLTTQLNLVEALERRGDYASAAKWGEKVLLLARRSGEKELEEELERKLAGYKAGKPR